jgi:hypothetical protein
MHPTLETEGAHLYFFCFCCICMYIFYTKKNKYLTTESTLRLFLIMKRLFSESHSSTVCIATSYGLDGGGVGVRVPVGEKNVYFFILFRLALGPTRRLIQWGTGGGSFPR